MKTAHLWLRQARPLTFVLGVALSLWAMITFFATTQIVIRDSGLIIPDTDVWTTVQLENALTGLGLPENFYAIYSLGFAFIFMLVFLVCGWLTLLRKSLDWFGLYLTLLLLGWASGFRAFSTVPQVFPRYETFNSYLSWFLWPGLFFLLYFFPSGHVTPRWTRWFALGWGLFSAYGLVATIFDRLPETFIYFLPLLFAVLLVGGYAQIYRFRHARALERQQIKWVVTALLLMVVSFIFTALFVNFTGLSDPQQSSPSRAFAFHVIFSAIGNLTFVGVPISIALAMLRYRLWDVDIIIRRTLVYTVLTATLGLVYFGMVILLEGALRSLVGGSGQVATVVSTLAVAALFTPLRRRVQEVIDRRFYRRKYNAEQALAEFAAAARSETDLETLSAQVVGIVQHTMQPESLSLWIKETHT